MKRSTRILSIILVVIMALIFCGFSGMQGMAAEAEGSENSQQFSAKIVTTIFPIYDWVRSILGERFDEENLQMLYNNGVDPHSFQPSIQDIMTVSSCDLFVYIGGESDAWIEDALRNAVNPQMRTLNLMDILEDAVQEENFDENLHTGGNPGDPAEDEEQKKAQSGAIHKDTEYDEHVWLSLRNAEKMVDAIAKVLEKMDPSGQEVYQDNAAAYQKQLEDLDQEYTKALSDCSKNTLIFGDRFPFLYLTEDYGLSYYAAFAGCSAETEASFETIIFLSGKLNELGLHYVLTIENADTRIAETLIQSSNAKDQEILVLNSMQSVRSEDMEAGITYLGIMRENLDVLKTALK